MAVFAFSHVLCLDSGRDFGGWGIFSSILSLVGDIPLPAEGDIWGGPGRTRGISGVPPPAGGGDVLAPTPPTKGDIWGGDEGVCGTDFNVQS